MKRWKLACLPEEAEQPDREEPAMPPSEQGEEQTLCPARQYRRERLRLVLAERLLDFAYLAVLTWLLVPGAEAAAAGGFWSRTLHVARMVALVLLGNWALSVPLLYWRTFVLEHRYGLSRLGWGGWLWRQAKLLAVGLAFSTALFTGLFWCIWWFGPWWFVAAAGAFLLVSVVLGQVVPVVVLPLFYRVRRLDQPQLLELFEPLVRRAGLRLEGIYRLELSRETIKANAALTGLGRTRRVLLSDTLLERLAPEELRVVVAHELGHHVHRHLLRLMLWGALGSLAGFWLCDLVVFRGWPGLPAGEYTRAGPGHVPALLLAINVLSVLGQPIGNAISRHFERQADHYALEQTGAPEAFIRTMDSLARLNQTDPEPPRWEVWWLHSHPPVSERIEMARRWAPKTASGTAPPLPG